METKSFSGSVKVDAEGKGQAVFATLGVVDKDGDFTEKGAFGTQTAKLSPAHDWSAPGMGLAKIRESGNDVVADFQFNMEMSSAKEWAASLKFNQEHDIPQEWSYGFDVKESAEETRGGERVRVLQDMKVYEVSPVMVGAGVNTRTTQMKASRKLEDHFADVVAQNRDFANRLEDLKSKRAEDGRSLSQANRERVTQLIDELAGITKQAGELIVVPDDSAALVALLQLEIESGQRVRAEGTCH